MVEEGHSVYHSAVATNDHEVIHILVDGEEVLTEGLFRSVEGIELGVRKSLPDSLNHHLAVGDSFLV